MIGLLLMSLGLTLMIKADLGMSPWGVFQLGISYKFGIPFGLGVQIVGFFLLFIAYFLGKIKPKPGTIVNMIIVGIIIDFIFYPVIPFFTILWQQIVFMVLSTFILAAGTSIYMSADLGAGPRDSLMMAIFVITNKSLRFIRTVMEITVLVIGFFIGGKIGAGTVIYALTFGALMHASFKLLKRLPLNLVRIDILKYKETRDEY